MEVTWKEEELEDPGGVCVLGGRQGSCWAAGGGLGRWGLGPPMQWGKTSPSTLLRLPQRWEPRHSPPIPSGSGSSGPTMRGEGPAVKLNPDVQQQETSAPSAGKPLQQPWIPSSSPLCSSSALQRSHRRCPREG